MQPNEHADSPRSRYDSCDPQYLRDLRKAAGMEVEALARTACLSVAQVRALESESGVDVFYSHTIRRQAYKRVLMILGAEPPTVEVPKALRDAHQVAEAHLNTLDQIVAMSHQPPINFTLLDRLRELGASLVRHKQFLGSLSFLVAALVLFVFYGPLQLMPESTKRVATETPASAAASVEAVASEAAPVAPAAPAAPKASEASEASAPAVATPPVQAATIAASAPTAQAVTHTACAYSNDAMPQVTPFIARKEGTYVYVISSANTELCVVDGNKQATALQLKAGENRTIPGVAPWQISGANLQQVQIYFQGGRVTVPEEASRRLKLVELPVAR